MATNTTTKSLSFRRVLGVRRTDGYDVVANGKTIGYCHRVNGWYGGLSRDGGRWRSGWSNGRDGVDYPTRKAAATALLAA